MSKITRLSDPGEPLDYLDILAAAVAALAIVAYAGLVAIGEVEFQASVIEALAED